MTSPRRIGAALASAMVLALWSCHMVGCARAPDPTPATKADQVYTLRGQIAMLPDPAKPANELQIRHEPIPNFVNKQGQVVGMNAMIMPFSPAPELSLAEFAVGDLIEFSFEVRWTSRPASRVTAIRKLPADTKLNFGRINPEK